MGAGAFIEPLVVVSLLVGGTWINRNSTYTLLPKGGSGCWSSRRDSGHKRNDSTDNLEAGLAEDDLMVDSLSRSSSPQRKIREAEPTWRTRHIWIFGLKVEPKSPNTRVFKDRFLSRFLLKFPFLVEVWYWALIYWIYQLGRAFTAVNIAEGTVHIARRHALQVISLEKQLHLFHEVSIQSFFLNHPSVLRWINRTYSFIHIPGTIFFLVWLYHYTTTRNRSGERQQGKEANEADGSPAGPNLYEARRRTMAVCNLVAFIVFTSWPCMPPRLLNDRTVNGPFRDDARSFGFVDTVHGVGGESSVWTQNRFCNQYVGWRTAAMPSLHFGYALLIGLTIALIPLAPTHRRSHSATVPIVRRSVRLPSARRLLCILVGLSYSSVILVAIIATANHFILDAVAGACICALAWRGNRCLLNLLLLEDYFLWCLRIHTPVGEEGEVEGSGLLGWGGVE